jgi:hypothetical protein
VIGCYQKKGEHMLIIPIAILVAAVYSTASVQFGRKTYRQIKIDAYKTYQGRNRWQDHEHLYTVTSLIVGFIWPVIFVGAFTILGVYKFSKGIHWLMSHDQDIPADTMEKIAKLEKELFPEDKKSVSSSPSNSTMVAGYGLLEDQFLEPITFSVRGKEATISKERNRESYWDMHNLTCKCDNCRRH